MSYDNLSSVSQNVLKFYQQLTGEERGVPFIFVLLFILVSFSLLKLKIKYLLASEWNIVSFQSKENPK
jgi:multidrug transporter EmrE-like cation transporter